MHTRAASAIALVMCLVLSPILFAAEKDKAPAPAKTETVKKDTVKQKTAKKETVKKETVKKSDAKKPAGRSAGWIDSKSGSAPTVRAIPYQAPRSGSAVRAASTRPADAYIFTTPPRYDYFKDHYGSKSGADIVGYVAPEGSGSKRPAQSSSNSGNPFVYRRGQ